MSNQIDIRELKKNRDAEKSEPERQPGMEKGWLDFLNREISFGGRKLPDRFRESFYLEMWSMMDAGLDIKSSLDLVHSGLRKKKARDIVDEVREAVIGGASFSSALKKTGAFSSYEYFSVQIGEETGKLLRVMKELGDFFTKKIRQRRQIISAVTYPLVVLAVAFAAVSFMVSFVVPMFADTFKRFGSDLPGLTKMVISASAFLSRFTGFFLLTLSGITVFCIWQSRQTWFRKFTSALLLKIPVIGGIIHKVYLSRFANTMSLLIGSRIPMIQAIQMTGKMISFYPIEHSLINIEEQVMMGTALHKALEQNPVYPAKMVSIVRVGEEVNQLELFFSRLAEQYASDTEHETGMLSKFLEPLIIIILGLVVGVILVAMYLPMFRMGQTI